MTKPHRHQPSATRNGAAEHGVLPAATEGNGAPPADPPPPGEKGRRRAFDSLGRVRRELSRVYFAQKDGQLDMDTAKGRTYLLSQIAAVLKAEDENDERIREAVRKALEDRK
jgi:hypothetical protein